MIVAAIVGSVALFLAGIGVAAWATFGRQHGPWHPDEWDPRVEQIAQFVQDERGVLYEHPVYVDFLSEDEFKADVTSSDEDLTDDDRAEIDQTESTLRALGLVEGDIDLFAEQNQLTGEGTLAYYDPETERVRVKGTEMTPALEVTLAHELTHALQDQMVDLDEVRENLDSDDAVRFRSVVEGDASNVEDAYASKELTDDEHARYVEESKAQSDVDLDGVPPALVAFFEAPYAIGPSFDQIVQERGGSSALDALLRNPPTTDRQLLDPRAYFDHTDAVPVDTPAVPDGAESLDDGEFGALQWYVVLASRIAPIRTLDIVDNWAGDSYVSYRLDGKVCVKSRYVARDASGAEKVEDAMDLWIQDGMSDSANLIKVDERTLELVACDPGADASVPSSDVGVEDLLGAPAMRLSLVAEAMDSLDGDLDAAWCAADGVVRAIPREALTSQDLSVADRRTVAEVMTGCGLQPG
jgi:hypothetical protein